MLAPRSRRAIALIAAPVLTIHIGAAAQKAYAPPRTPWGHPDLQGVWTSDDARSVPLQRPAELGDRRMLTDEEFAARKQRDDETRGDVRVAAGTFVGEVGTRSLRHTSLVVDPPNGRVPARTPAAEQRMAAIGKAVNPLLPATWEDRSLFERCISRGPLAALPTLYGNGLRIVQSPTTVAISHEMIHEARLIPVAASTLPPAQGRPETGPGTTGTGSSRTQSRDDLRPALPQPFRSYMGYSTGRWDGDTLVITTTGFTDKTAIAGTRHTDKLRIVERISRVSDETLSYEATVSDPDTWVAPWTVALPLSTQPGYQVFPYECHEGNHALRNMLSAAREEERVREEYIRKGLEPPPLARPGDANILPVDPSFGRRR